METSSEKPLFTVAGESALWQSKWWALGILLLALALRLYIIGWPPFDTGVESMHSTSSVAYVETGRFAPENDHTAPLRRFLSYPTLKLMGDTPIARRLPNAIFGGLTAFFLVLLGQQLFPRRPIGPVAGLFLATDPFHIAFSRTTWEDIPAPLFVIAGAYFLARAVSAADTRAYPANLIASGIFLAMAVSTRRYVAAILVAVLASLLYTEAKTFMSRREPGVFRRCAFVVAVFAFLPMVLYAFLFYPWFARGYSLSEWPVLQVHQIKEELTDASMQETNAQLDYGNSGRASDWFTRTIVFGSQMPTEDGQVSTAMIINNPISWLLILPALAFVGYLWRRKRSFSLALPILGFALIYFPFLMARRVILVYSALSVLPAAFLLLAVSLESVRDRKETALRTAAGGLAGLIIVTNLLFYPVAIALPLPRTVSLFIPFTNRLATTNETGPSSQ